MVKEFAADDRGSWRLLWNQFGSSHVLTVPIRGTVKSDLETLVRSRVCRILVVRGEVDVTRYR